MSAIWAKIAPIAKAIAGAVFPLVTVSLTTGSLDWKGIVAAAFTAVAVYLVPNGTKASPKPVSGPVVTPPAK